MATIMNSMTYIQNSNFPTGVTSGTSAQTFTYPIQALASTAAIRLDFQTAVFDQPTAATGNCGSDTVTFTEAATSTTTALCGTLTGQHVYLDNNGMANVANTLTITIAENTNTNSNNNLMRTWKILVTIL